MDRNEYYQPPSPCTAYSGEVWRLLVGLFPWHTDPVNYHSPQKPHGRDPTCIFGSELAFGVDRLRFPVA